MTDGSKDKASDILWTLGLAGAGAVTAVVAVPIVVGAVGFGGGGITAGSAAAGMMSSAAVAHGGGVAAGSTVAVLQSVGAAGLGLKGAALVSGFGAATTTALSQVPGVASVANYAVSPSTYQHMLHQAVDGANKASAATSWIVGSIGRQVGGLRSSDQEKSKL